MRKLFLIPVLMLFTCVNMWAVNVATWGELMEAVATPNAAITLTADCNIPAAGTYDFNGATITCGAYKLVGGAAGDVFTFKNATFTGGTTQNNPAIKVSAGDSVSLVNIASTNINAACIQSIALVLRIGEDCNMACNTRFHAVSNGYNGAKIYNYGTIRGISTNGSIATIYNYGTITSISQGETSNAIYVSNRSITINNYGLCNGMLYNYSGCGVTIHNYSTGEMVGGVGNRDTGDDGYAKANITNEGVFTQTQSVNHGGFSLINHGTATIQNGTFVKSTRNKYNFLELTGTKPIHIYNGTGTRFVDVPAGDAAIIHPNCIFEQGVGNHTIVDGYYWRESDGMIVEIPHYVAEITHANSEVEYSTDLHEALTTAADGDIIKMIDDATLNYTARLNVNQSVAAKHLTLDINGHELRAITSVVPTLELYAGSLNIINSNPGVGGIYNEAASAIAINVYGTVLKNCNPKTAAIEALYTYLNIAEGVNIYATTSGSSAIVVNHATEYRENDEVINKGTEIYVNYTAPGTGEHCGVANGVRVDVHGSLYAQKYAFKVNGTVGYPDASIVSSKTSQTYGEYFESVKEYFYGPGTTESISVADTAYSPFIHIYPSAILDADNDDSGAAGIYASGYARWIIEGTSKGTSGLYIRSGKVTLKEDATIQSTYEGAAGFEPGKKSGISTTGNAILVNPKSGYPGHIVFNVEGDAKISTGATGGAALFEYVQLASLLESIAINGGQFTGPYALAISEATQASGNVVVFGTTLTAEHVADVTGILAENTHKIVIPNNNGTTTVVVSKGETPTEVTDFGNTSDPQAGEVVSLLPGSDVNWTGTEPGVIGDGTTSTTLTLGELQIVSGTAENKQELTIKENSELKVDRLILNDNARIIIEKGAKLIVEGEQGINAPSEDNLQLVSSEDVQSMFLLNPAVASNRHPSATYKFKSKARGNTETEQYTWQRFGIPTFDGKTSMTWEGSVKTALYEFNYASNQWVNIPKVEANHFELEGKPFQCYNMTNNSTASTDAENDIEYTFTGELMGNGDGELKFLRGWNFYANSFTAPINMAALLTEIRDEFGDGVSGTVYIYDRNDETGATAWNGINIGHFEFFGESYLEEIGAKEILPMQAFVLNLRDRDAAEGAINYERNVYNPALGIESPASSAPQRDYSNNTGVVLSVTDGTETDKLTLFEADNFSDKFDDGYDAEKLANDFQFSIYCIENDTKLSALASNSLVDKAIAFDAKKAGEFTLKVDRAVGELVKIYDVVANKLINLNEKAEYKFTAEAKNDPQRFIINPSDAPSAIDNTEMIVKATKFVGADGQLYIRRADKVYTVQGIEVK